MQTLSLKSSPIKRMLPSDRRRALVIISFISTSSCFFSSSWPNYINYHNHIRNTRSQQVTSDIALKSASYLFSFIYGSTHLLQVLIVIHVLLELPLALGEEDTTEVGVLLDPLLCGPLHPHRRQDLAQVGVRYAEAGRFQSLRVSVTTSQTIPWG